MNGQPGIYVAAPFPMRHSLRWFRDRLVEHGWRVTSTWIDVEPDEEDVSWEVREAAAVQCIHEVRAADILAIVTDLPSEGRGGRFVELGYAMALGMRIWRVGERSNIFTSAVDREFVNLAHCLAWSRSLRSDIAAGVAVREGAGRG